MWVQDCYKKGIPVDTNMIQGKRKSLYDNFTTIQVDYSIGFTYDADAGEIARLLALNELNFILHDSVIFLSYRALTELLNEAEELWS